MRYGGLPEHSHFVGEFFVESVAVDVYIGCIERDEVAAHIPCAFIFVVCTPGVFDHVVFSAILVLSLAVDEHYVVVGRFPVVKPFLA